MQQGLYFRGPYWVVWSIQCSRGTSLQGTLLGSLEFTVQWWDFNLRDLIVQSEVYSAVVGLYSRGPYWVVCSLQCSGALEVFYFRGPYWVVWSIQFSRGTSLQGTLLVSLQYTILWRDLSQRPPSGILGDILPFSFKLFNDNSKIFIKIINYLLLTFLLHLFPF